MKMFAAGGKGTGSQEDPEGAPCRILRSFLAGDAAHPRETACVVARYYRYNFRIFHSHAGFQHFQPVDRHEIPFEGDARTIVEEQRKWRNLEGITFEGGKRHSMYRAVWTRYGCSQIAASNGGTEIGPGEESFSDTWPTAPGAPVSRTMPGNVSFAPAPRPVNGVTRT